MLQNFSCACWSSVSLPLENVYSCSDHFLFGLFGFCFCFVFILSCMSCLYTLEDLEDLHSETYKALMEEIEDDSRNGKISDAVGLEELILIKWPYN